MSLAYTVYVATSLSPEQVDRALADDVTTSTRAAKGAPTVRRQPAATVHPVSQAMFDDSYGFRPTVAATFDVPKWDDREWAELGPLAEIAELLRSAPGDAYVNYSGLVTALLRRGDVITINAEWLAGRPWLRRHLPDLFGPACQVAHVPEPE